MEKYIHHSDWFYGNKISAYGLEHGYVDYATLAKSFDAVLNNYVFQATTEHCIGEWETVNGDDYYYYDDNGEEITREEYEENGGMASPYEYYQMYIISESGAKILEDCTDETVWFNEELNMYVWGVNHWGASWDYVLTDIRIEKEEG